ncbi:MAG: site-specific integrase [Burkholderiaceae bacterium]|nr:site-specific integrase [Burkholderiaceae bacterium]
MANLEVITYCPMREIVEGGNVRWVCDKMARPIHKLPQIFWGSGEPWNEVNHWALTKATSTVGGHNKTVNAVMKHLAAYASWLEINDIDWRHFPMLKQNRAAVLYRGELIAQRDRGNLSPSTASVRMAAVIQFYRHCHAYGLMQRHSPLWRGRQVVIRYYDIAGFKRAIERTVSDLAIPNRPRPGLRLEDGLTPLKEEDASTLLEFTKEQGLYELWLMLSLGVLTGARIESITTLSIRNIESAYPDADTPDTFRMPVGPGTGVKTKFGVNGELMVPRFLIDQLNSYAYSIERLRRQGRASESNREVLFLTIRGNPYESSSFNRLMTDLRRRAIAAGMRFMQTFKFHQTRATFGTWLMEVALRVTDVGPAVAFVRDAMLHKDERTTMLYVRFHQKAKIKAEVANEFNAIFSGVVNRDWSQYDA